MNVSGLISSSEVVVTEVYDTNRRKQIKLIIPLLINNEILCDFLANTLIKIRINETTAGWT